jgi:hypothetical protein
MEKLSNLHRIGKLYGLPEFVKEAQFNDDETILPSTAFADPWARHYPCHTKAATYVSNITFWERAITNSNPEDAVIGRRLMEFATDWGIDTDVKSALTKVAHDVKNAIPRLTGNDFALVVGNDYKYPIADAETVKQSTENFCKQAHLYPYAWRKSIAGKIAEKAAAFHVDLGGRLDKLVNPVPAKRADIAEDIETRAYTVKDASIRTRLLQMSSKVKSNQFDVAALDKLASILDECDRKTGIYKQYRSQDSRGHLPLPEDVCFEGATAVKAASDEMIHLQTGYALAKSDLQQAGLEAFKVLPEYLDSVSTYGQLDLDKAAEVIPTMPRDEALLLEQAVGSIKQANFNMTGGDVTQPIKPLLPQQRQMAAKGVPWDSIGKRQINLKGDAQTKQADITGDGVGRPPGGNMGAYSPATSYNKNVNKFPTMKPSMLAAQQAPARGLPSKPNPAGMPC